MQNFKKHQYFLKTISVKVKEFNNFKLKKIYQLILYREHMQPVPTAIKSLKSSKNKQKAQNALNIFQNK